MKKILLSTVVLIALLLLSSCNVTLDTEDLESNETLPISIDDVTYIRDHSSDSIGIDGSIKVDGDKATIQISITETSGSITLEVISLEKVNDKIIVNIIEHIPQIGTCDMAYWTILINTTSEYVGSITYCEINLTRDTESYEEN